MIIISYSSVKLIHNYFIAFKFIYNSKIQDSIMLHVKVVPLSDSGYSSQIYNGLFELHAENKIELKFSCKSLATISERKDWGSSRNHRIAYLEVHQSGRNTKKICYDMLDGPEIISLSGLEKCDFYFKRSYSRSFLDQNKESSPQNLRNKIHPYGLNNRCYSQNEFQALRRFIIYLHLTRKLYKFPFNSAKEISRVILGRTNKDKNYIQEVSPDIPHAQKIMFQTRLFDPDTKVHSDEVREINEHRVNIVRALKNEFKDRFVGGLFPEKIAKSQCPDLITPYNTNRDEYFSLVKDNQISIMTRGLRQSIGWRLPEYLMMSRCIVSQSLAYELPESLIEGKNIFSYNTIDECLSACHRLLTDQNLANEMRKNNFDYYQRNVKPAALIWNTLRVATDNKTHN